MACVTSLIDRGSGGYKLQFYVQFQGQLQEFLSGGSFSTRVEGKFSKFNTVSCNMMHSAILMMMFPKAICLRNFVLKSGISFKEI